MKNNNNLSLVGVLAAVFLFATTAVPQGVWISSDPVNAQMDSGNQTAVIDQLVSNLSQAKEAVRKWKLYGGNYAIDRYNRRAFGYTWQSDN